MALVKALKPDDVELLAEMLTVVMLERGESVTEVGELADYAIILLAGRLEVVGNDAIPATASVSEELSGVVCTVKAGEMFGEEAVILDQPVRNWEERVEAARKSRVALLPRKEVQRLRSRSKRSHHQINLWLGMMALDTSSETHQAKFARELGRKYIILTCDNTPSALAVLTHFVQSNHEFFARHQKELIGPKDVLADVTKTTGITFVHSVQAPLLGGAMELGDLVARTRVRASFVFRDTRCTDHCAFEALLRTADLYAVPSATNPASADCLVRYLQDRSCPI